MLPSCTEAITDPEDFPPAEWAEASTKTRTKPIDQATGGGCLGCTLTILSAAPNVQYSVTACEVGTNNPATSPGNFCYPSEIILQAVVPANASYPLVLPLKGRNFPALEYEVKLLTISGVGENQNRPFSWKYSCAGSSRYGNVAQTFPGPLTNNPFPANGNFIYLRPLFFPASVTSYSCSTAPICDLDPSEPLEP